MGDADVDTDDSKKKHKALQNSTPADTIFFFSECFVLVVKAQLKETTSQKNVKAQLTNKANLA